MSSRSKNIEKFNTWLDAYDTYIRVLWDIYVDKVQYKHHIGEKAVYEDFVEFVYEHSDKFISPYQ